jgi:hypothetical protein
MIQVRMDASRKRLLYYLLLNVLVSACVTVSVLFVYDHYYRPATGPEALIQAGGAPTLEITAVVGAGIPSSETVILRNTGTTQADLKNWTLRDEDSNVYTFADVTLLSNGSVQLHTAPGTDTLIDLYWGLTASVWRSGETVTLLDPAGSVRSVYKVP